MDTYEFFESVDNLILYLMNHEFTDTELRTLLIKYKKKYYEKGCRNGMNFVFRRMKLARALKNNKEDKDFMTEMQKLSDEISTPEEVKP